LTSKLFVPYEDFTPSNIVIASENFTSSDAVIPSEERSDESRDLLFWTAATAVN